MVYLRIMPSKQNIKETINLLCKIINHHRATKLTPETFRIAKFNKDEATAPMWSLLFETNYFLNHGSFLCGEDESEEMRRDMVFWTKHEMFSRGYFIKDFFILPDDMHCGSREILLAFGWLMSKEKLLRNLMENCSNFLEECLPLKEELIPRFDLVVSENFGSSSTKLSKTSKISVESTNLDQLSWILGNLRLTCNGLYSAEQRLVSLVSKVHCGTLGTDNVKGHLSTLEVFLLRHPKELVKFQEKLENYNLYLVSLLKLVEHEDVFWKWMESVYETKLTDSQGTDKLEYNTCRNCKTCQEDKTEEVKKFSKTRSELEKALDEGNTFYLQACEIIRRTGYEPCDDLNIDQLGLNEQMKSLCFKESVSISRNNVQTFPELKKLPTSSSDTTCSVKNEEPSCAQQGIELLRRNISELEVKVMEMKKVHLETLGNLTSHLEESVCIPPIVHTSKYDELQNR